MEAIAALSLACNVIQVVDFGIKVASKSRELYRDGSTSENEDLRHTTDQLFQASTSLEKSMKGANDKELETIAIECQSAAQKLLLKLDDLKLGANKNSRGIRAFGRAVKSISQKDAITQLQARLEACRRSLDTGILAHLW